MEFDYEYFKNYKENWQKESYLPHAISALSTAEYPHNTVLILGAATGEPLLYLKDLSFKAWGIEKSPWALENLHPEAKNFVSAGCISEILPKLADEGHTYDFVFSSCLQYLDEDQIHKLLPTIKGLSRSFCHYGGFKGFGDDESDPRLLTLKDFSWWKELFTKAGFKNQLSPYLWKS